MGRKRTHPTGRRVGDVDPSGVANLYGTWQPRPQGFSLKKWLGPSTHFLREKPWGRGWGRGIGSGWHLVWNLSPVRAHSLWAGPCPEKQVKNSYDEVTKLRFPLFRLKPALGFVISGKVCRFLTENLPTDWMKNKISRQYFRVLPSIIAFRRKTFSQWFFTVLPNCFTWRQYIQYKV